MLKDYYGWHERFDMADSDRREFDEFWDEYRSRCHQTRKFRDFLGQNLYEKLVDQFGFNS
jgi:hypothetical protein